jgi:thioredoxin-related protein
MTPKRVLIAILLFIGLSFTAQEENHGLVKWMTFKEAQAKNKEVVKPLLIDIYTDWCGWCKHMIKTTYSNPMLAEYINQNFYPVQFNAETKDTIEYDGQTYKPYSLAPRTPHELAVKFLGEKQSYPSTIFVANNYKFSMLSQGYMDDKKIEPLLVFMVENAWQTTNFDDFNKHFIHCFQDTNYKKAPVKIYKVTELEQLQKKKPKKAIVTLSADFCNTGKVMNNTTFSDTSIAPIIKKYFYLSYFNEGSKDTVKFKNEKYFPVPVNGYPLHSLGIKLTNNRFSIPALCILDEQLNTIDVLNFYQGHERLKPILEFIGSDAYKKKSFNDFMQEYTKPKTTKAKK